MTPQSSLTIVAPIDSSRRAELSALLASMNVAPGTAAPQNAIIPFGAFDRLHFARLIVLDDQTAGDLAAPGVPPRPPPVYLAVLFDCDGAAETFLRELVQRAESGLRQLFAYCWDPPDGDLLGWMRRHDRPAAALYVNWVGRTVRQVREEAALHGVLRRYVEREGRTLARLSPQDARRVLREFVSSEVSRGSLALNEPAATPTGWWLQNMFHSIVGPFLVVLALPLLLLYLPVFAIQLRSREKRDPVVAPPPEADHARLLFDLEDRGVTNQFSAMGTIKPGLFRKATISAALAFLNYAVRHVYNRGRLARVSTIHFARWVFLPEGNRILFASNYDGSLDSYMDDFINKVAFGLNLVFSNGVGYPATRWLLLGGAKDEQKFKYYIRRLELPTEVWYDAYPDLAAVDLQNNTSIREGLGGRPMSDGEIVAWMSLI